MTFLLVYDRRARNLATLKQYTDEMSGAALQERLRLELLYKDSAEIEVVTLSSGSEDELRRTHSRYFEDAGKLLENLKTAEASAADAA